MQNSKKTDLCDKILIQYIIKSVIKNKIDDLVENELKALIKEIGETEENKDVRGKTIKDKKTI